MTTTNHNQRQQQEINSEDSAILPLIRGKRSSNDNDDAENQQLISSQHNVNIPPITEIETIKTRKTRRRSSSKLSSLTESFYYGTFLFNKMKQQHQHQQQHGHDEQRNDDYYDDDYDDDESTQQSLRSIVSDVFSDIRSESTATIKANHNEAYEYLDSTILQRAFPERLFALCVTLLFEIPVLIMVSGGSDKLCGLIGRSKYQLLMGFLPLSSAISGNVGLQASTLTTRAVSHEHVTITNYTIWLQKEIGAALYLGLAMGFVLGSIAYILSEFHFGFASTIMIAQFVSILTAGLTGTLAPLLFSFIFERDAGKWGGPLETAIQDIIGSFAMVVLSYKILELYGPFDIDPTDICGISDI